MRRFFIASFSLLATAAACVPTSACDDYVDYMCDCHPEEDCAELRTIHQDAVGEELTDCTIALDEQKEEDVLAENECATADGADSGAK
jgi:hypothetical protein